MTSVGETHMKTLKKLGIFSAGEAEKTGVPRSALYRLKQAEKILQIAPGIFSHPDVPLDGTELDYAAACKTLGPKAVIGGLSALVHYRLTDAVPQQLWVLIPQQKRTWNRLFRVLRTTSSLDVEVETQKFYRIVSIERALIEGLKYSTKLGLETALTAIRTAIQEKKTNMQKLGRAADALGMRSIIYKHWEAIIS